MASSQGATSGGERFADWRNVEDYPSPESDGETFAWEFLRRSPKYQEAWSDYVAWLREKANGNPVRLVAVELIDRPDKSKEILGSCGISSEAVRAAEKSMLGFDMQAVLVVVNGADRVKLKREIEAQQWGLKSMLSPRLRELDFPLAFLKSSPVLALYSSAQMEYELLSLTTRGGNKYVLSIDLDFPLQRIERRLGEMIRRMQAARVADVGREQVARARNGEKLVRYLRILDASQEGASTREIARGLLPEWAGEPPSNVESLDKRIEASRSEAIELRDGKYKSLPILMSEPERARKPEN